MPGIVGIISKANRTINEDSLKKMVSSINHEQFYNTGSYIDESIGCYIGWAVDNESMFSILPIYNNKKDKILFFDGNNYFDEKAIQSFNDKGYESKKDYGNYLIQLYEEYGNDFYSMLNGFFSGVLLDLNKSEVTIFNDRFGMNRVFFYENDKTFMFASEAKAILKVNQELRQIDYQGLGEFFSCGCVLENRTLFHNIRLLPGGAKWTFYKNNEIEKAFYFSPTEWETQEKIGRNEFYKKFKETFRGILPKYFNTEKKIAFSITGGIDTRMILSCRDLLPKDLQCYTHAGMYRDSYDVKIGRKVAEYCGFPHMKMLVGENYLKNFHEYAEKSVYISDGYLDVTQSVGLYTCQSVREFASVRVTGNYGSEVMRNLIMFKPSLPSSSVFHESFYDNIQLTKETYKKALRCNPLSFIVFKQAPWHLYNRMSVEKSQIRHQSPFMDNDLLRLLYMAPKEDINSNALSLRFIADMDFNLYRIITDRGFCPDYNSLRLLFSKAYHEFLFKMDYYYNHGMPQGLSKFNHYFAFLKLENIFLGTHKYNHFRVWFRDQLSDYVKEILLDSKSLSRSYLKKEKVIEMVNYHTQGCRNYTNELSMLLTTELMHRKMIDN